MRERDQDNGSREKGPQPLCFDRKKEHEEHFLLSIKQCPGGQDGEDGRRRTRKNGMDIGQIHGEQCGASSEDAAEKIKTQKGRLANFCEKIGAHDPQEVHVKSEANQERERNAKTIRPFNKEVGANLPKKIMLDRIPREAEEIGEAGQAKEHPHKRFCQGCYKTYPASEDDQIADQVGGKFGTPTGAGGGHKKI